MAGNSNPSIKIKLNLQNLQEVLNGYKQLSVGTSEVSNAAAQGIKTISKLLKATESGTKVTRSTFSDLIKEFQDVEDAMDKAYHADKKRSLQLARDYDAATKKLVELRTLQDQLSKDQKVAANNANVTNIFKELKKTSLTELGFSREEIKKYGGSKRLNALKESLVGMEDIKHRAKLNPTKEEEMLKTIISQRLVAREKELNLIGKATKETKRIEKEEADVAEKIKKQKELIEEIKQKRDTDTFSEQKEGVFEVKEKSGSVLNEMYGYKTKMELGGYTVGELESNEKHINKLTKTFIRSTIVIRALKTALKTSVAAIREMDDAITNMTVITGEAREVTMGYIDDFRRMAQATSSTITEMASLTAEYIRQGRSMKDAQVMAEETAKAAKIAGISVADSLTYMTSAINGFNLSAKDASHVSDVFAELAAVSATDYNQLAVALSKVSAQANQAGMSIEYTTALLAKGIETTQEAPESIGTALKTIIARFRELRDFGSTLEDGVDVNGVESALSAVGIALRNEAGEFRNLQDVLNELGPIWDDLTGMQRQAIAQAAAGTRQQSRFLAIMQDWERTMELVTTGEEAAGAAAAQYSKYADGMTAALTNLKSAWQGIILSISDNQIIIDTIKTITEGLNFITEFLKGNSKLVTISLAGIGAIAAALIVSNKYQLKSLEMTKQRIRSITEAKEATEGEVNTLKARSRLEVESAKKKIQSVIDETNYRIDQQFALEKERKKSHLEELQDEKKTQKAKYETFMQEMRQLKRIAKAKGDKVRVQEINKETQAAYKEQLKFEEKQNEKIVEAKKEMSDLETKIKAKQTEATKEYQKSYNELNKMEKTIDSLPSGVFLLSSAFKDLGKNIINIFKRVGKDFASIKSGGLKGFAKTSTGSFLGTAATIGFLVHSLGSLQKTYMSYKNIEQESLGRISDNMSDVYNTKTKVNNLQDLREEYTLLSKKVHKTAEEEEKLKDIEEELNKNFSISGENIDEKIVKATEDMDVEISKNLENSLVEAFTVAAIKGVGIFEKQEFGSLIQNKMLDGFKIDQESSNEQSRYHKKIYSKVMKNYNTDAILKSVKDRRAKSDQARIQNAGNNGAAKGTFQGVLKGVGAGLATGNVFVGAGVGLATALSDGARLRMEYEQKEAQKIAKETTAEVNKEIDRINSEVNSFASEFSANYDKTFADKYISYCNLVQKYSGSTREAIEQTYSSFEILKKQNITKEMLNDMQMFNKETNSFALSDETMDRLISQAGELGEEAGSAFIKAWNQVSSNINFTGADSSAFGLIMAGAINGLSNADIAEQLSGAGFSTDLLNNVGQDLGDIIKESSKEAKEVAMQEKVAAENRLNDFNSTSFEAFMENDENSEFAGLEASEVRARLESRAKRAGQLFDDTAEQLDQMTSSLLDLISPFKDLTQLSQNLTGMESSIKNATEFADKIAKGEATAEDWASAATKYQDILSSDAWKNAKTNEERANLLRNKYSISNRQDRLDQIENYKTRFLLDQEIRKKELEEAKNAESSVEKKASIQAQIDALDKSTDATLQAVEGMKQVVDELTEKDLNQIEYSAKEKDIDKRIKKGDLSAYLDKMNLDNNMAQKQRDAANEYLNSQMSAAAGSGMNTDNWKTVMGDLYNGDLSSYKKWVENATDNEKETFKITFNEWKKQKDEENKYLESSQEAYQQYTDKKFEIQEQALSKYKEVLEKEYEETKKSLDKRKDIYQKYFDALDEEESKQDYEEEKNRLMSNISQLASANDAQSLSKMKDAQRELKELNEDRIKTERDKRKEATMTALAEEEKQIEDLHKRAMENNAEIWSNFEALGIETVKNLFRRQDGYYNMSEDQQKDWDKKWNETYGNLYNNVQESPDNPNSVVNAEVASAGAQSQETTMNNANNEVTKKKERENTTNNKNNYVNNVTFGDFNFDMGDIPETASKEEVAKMVYDIFREEMKKRGINFGYKQ